MGREAGTSISLSVSEKESAYLHLPRSYREIEKPFAYLHWQPEPEPIAVNWIARLGDSRFVDRVELGEGARSGVVCVVRSHRLVQVFSNHCVGVDEGSSSANGRQLTLTLKAWR